MRFLGRASELAKLESEWSHGSAFVVVYGRRRVGKTTLLKQFMSGKRVLYFLASRESRALNMKRFAQSAGAFAQTPAIGEAAFDDWRPLFQIIADSARSARAAVIIDELPYLVEDDPSFPSVLQYVWDEILKPAGIMLVLCGSSVHMMREITLEHDSPLFGRRTSQIHLRPLMFSEFEEGFSSRSFEDRMRVYSITGGVPKYLEFFDGEDDVLATVREHAFSTTGFLYDEPRFLLSQDTRSPITPLSLLRSIACGNHRLSDIASMMQRPSTDLAPYLKSLIRLGYVERRVPATEANPDRSKNGLYFIRDGLIDFWFNYVQPFEGELEMGNTHPSERAFANSFDSQFVASTFETVSRQALAALCADGQIPFEPNRIGAFWNRKGTIEIDVCATDAEINSILLGECKYHGKAPFSLREYHALSEKAVKASLSGNPVFCLFSKTGFDNKLIELAHEHGGIYLVNQNALVNP